MQWWENLAGWLQTDDGRLVLLGGVVPFVAILVAGLLAAGIARRSVSRVLARRDREARGAVIGLLVDVARQASMWSSSSPSERTLIERSAAEADIALRLLPAPGALLAADWASYEIASLRRASAAFSLEFETPLATFRDRLLEWHRSPAGAQDVRARPLALAGRGSPPAGPGRRLDAWGRGDRGVAVRTARRCGGRSPEGFRPAAGNGEQRPARDERDHRRAAGPVVPVAAVAHRARRRAADGHRLPRRCRGRAGIRRGLTSPGFPSAVLLRAPASP
ncbi:hypothetical protein [Naasia aerilata]|uniref:DUF4129 domain-containing protein n=1 Tax=Naasia aerilata TaxID=1162966 RepID=A0ABN6XNC1_9MICO|nr:hypothetical protein [Naasia aerilata]BDZ46477.1 hypothetical protein GCM10025866_23860 [Naasia aerilata]